MLEGSYWEALRHFKERQASASVRVEGEQSETFPIGVEMKLGCVMSPWLFYTYFNG